MQIAAAILIVVLFAALVGVTAAYVRVNRDMERMLDRLGIPSDRKVASRALSRGVRELEHRIGQAEAGLESLRIAVNETSLGIVIADAAGGIIFANPSAEVVLAGRAGEAVLRRELLDLIEAVRTTGSQQQREVGRYSPSQRLFRIRAVPVGVDGGAVAYIRDLSEQARVEALRRDFVANAGHELKTPLGALAVLAETLRDEDDDEQRRRLADRLTREAERTARVVDDILVLGAIESEEAPFEPVALSAVVLTAAERVALTADAVGVEVRCESDRDVWVEGNREQLVSAVANLLDNAIKYSPDTDAVVSCRTVVEDGWVSIAVHDNGIGIADQHLDRVFERFYRVDRARSRESGGTGLGLSIVRNVARTHGGSAAVESELGSGSTFTIRLPVLKEGNG